MIRSGKPNLSSRAMKFSGQLPLRPLTLVISAPTYSTLATCSAEHAHIQISVVDPDGPGPTSSFSHTCTKVLVEKLATPA